MTIPQVGYNILFSDKNCHQKMDPVKSYTDYRLGSRKSWEDLSSERKRKLRKLHFDSLDRKLLLHHRNLNSNLQPLYSVSNRPSTDFGVFLCTSLNDSKAVIITYDEVQSKCYRMPLWINKPFLDINSNDEQLNNAYVAVVM
ncbi:uncharacterized protein LOC123263177 isoform X7 [Cotesia glomerata]|uniref:uncharacterized protein LOC123263177 isoform X7 n=1 Tax=Cotesia glomerata TaxID=32391 RepID=UPI001D019918|nr:uncharacterized protein LOC123263177 isoform X7 [Cotesia glomerata]